MTALFIACLALSGFTAIPLQWEVDLLAGLVGVPDAGAPQPSSALIQWIGQLQTALHDINARYPFIGYGGDWLAFGHFAIAIAFIGAWRDPVRNRWLFDFGLLTCALLLPYALVFGAARGIPLWWRLIDCSFGVFGAIPLWLCRRWTLELSRVTAPDGKP